MLYYRLYFLLPDTGSIQHFTAFSAPDDAAALAISEGHEGGNPLELWCGARLVKRFEDANDLRAPLRAAR